MARVIYFLLLICSYCSAELCLRDNLMLSKPGDFIVTYQNKTYTLMHIQKKSEQGLTIEEISVPAHGISKNGFSWKNWVSQGAPNNSCWVRYDIDAHTGKIQSYYSYTRKCALDPTSANNFLTTLLNLQFSYVPYHDRKKLGRGGANVNDWRNLWQPKMVVNGQVIPGVFFEAWKTYWPKDQSDLAGKEILVYVPKESDKYPCYFPYWLQVSGMIEKAKLRIVDSGQGLEFNNQF